MKKKTLLIICAALVALLVGASVLYNGLADQVQTGGLVTQPPAETTEPVPDETVAESTAVPEASEVPETTEPIDYTVPDVTILDWDGNEVKISDFRGKPVILNFWASWCGPCKSEMPEFEEAYRKYGDEIYFVMVNCTGGRETLESAKAFIEESGYTFPVYFDTTYEAASAYGASSIPLTYFIDAEGYAIAYGQGALDAETLQRGVDMLYTPVETE